MKRLKKGALLLLAFIVISCHESAEMDNSELLEPVYGKDASITGVINGNSSREDDFYIEASGRIHRPKRDCNYGFGLCNWSIKVGFRIDEESEPDFTATIISNSSNRVSAAFENYFELQLDASLPEEFDTNFYIDEELESSGYSLIEGVYELDMEIGEFGGYRIPVSKLD